MSKAVFCIDCNRNVSPKRKFKFGYFILTGFFFYPIVYFCQKKQCPICGGTNFIKN